MKKIKNLLLFVFFSGTTFLSVNIVQGGLTEHAANSTKISSFDIFLKTINWLSTGLILLSLFFYLPSTLIYIFLYYRNLKKNNGKEGEEKKKLYAQKIKNLLARGIVLFVIGMLIFVFISTIHCNCKV